MVASKVVPLLRIKPVKTETHIEGWKRKVLLARTGSRAGHGHSLFIGQIPVTWPRLPAKDAGKESRHKPRKRRDPGFGELRSLSCAE